MSQLLSIIALALTMQVASAASVDLSNVKKIYYVLATAKGFGQSAFGHGYLRLGEQDKPSGMDYVIEFVADTTPENLGYLRGAGLSLFNPNYDRAVVLKRYSQIIPEMNYLTNRDLISYEIKMDDKQRSSILAALASAIETGKMGDYSFFTRNCAQAISALFKIGDIDIKGLNSVVPLFLPAELEKRGLVESITTDYSITTRRELLEKKYDETIQKAFQNLDFKMPASMLTSGDIMSRVVSFTALQENLTKLSIDDQVMLKGYLAAFTFLENRVTRNVLIEKLKGKDSLKLHEIISNDVNIIVNYSQMNRGYNVNVGETNFFYEDGEVFLKYKIVISPKAADDTAVNKFRFVKFKLDQTEIVNNSEVYAFGKFIGILSPKKINKNSVIATHGWISDFSEFDESTHTLKIRSLITSQEFINSEDKVLGKLDESSIKNGFNKYPMCFALVDFEKKLLERVLFVPNEPALSGDENLALVTELMAGKIIVVPGFSDAMSWTSSLDQEKTAQMIYAYQKKNYTSLLGALGLYFNQKSLDEEGIRMINSLAQKGIYTPIFFKTKFAIAHAVLVTGVKQKSEKEFYLKAYDSNLNIQSDQVSAFTNDFFVFNKEKNTLNSFAYTNKEGVEAFLLKPDADTEFFLRDVVLDEEIKKYILFASKKYQKNSFTISEILSGY